jgi:hypothetical protein
MTQVEQNEYKIFSKLLIRCTHLDDHTKFSRSTCVFFSIFSYQFFFQFFFWPKILPKKINFTLEKTKFSENFQKKLVGKKKHVIAHTDTQYVDCCGE